MRVIIGALLAPAVVAAAQFTAGLTGYAYHNPAHLGKLVETVLFMTVPWVYGFSAVVGVPLFFLFRQRQHYRSLCFCGSFVLSAASAGILVCVTNPGPDERTDPRATVMVAVLFAGLAALESVVFCIIAGWAGPRRWVSEVKAG
jgi:hypothetical protein